MSSLLWKAFFEDDLGTFDSLLQQHATPAGSARPSTSGSRSVSAAAGIAAGSSPGYLASSPNVPFKGRRSAGFGGFASTAGGGAALTKADVNSRDAMGRTILHHAVSSTSESANGFVAALIDHPFIDLYVQDYESGWTALHRAFYFGNMSVARLILERDAADALGRTTGHVQQTIGLIKVKDKEGLGPFDLYAATIKDRTLRPQASTRGRSGSQGSEEERMPDNNDDEEKRAHIPIHNVNCDQLFTFGSNKNVSLGFGDEDDRQYPERINLRRPEQLLRRFHAEHTEQVNRKMALHDPAHHYKNVNTSELWIEDVPYLPKTRPITIQDVQMSKLHSAVLTTDPESNLYVCGHGQGGRLGTGDEQTRFHFVCVNGTALAGKRIATVALGLNHTLALSDEGESFSWGSNGYGQLGYTLPRTSSDEEPISTVPRQIYGPLKRELVMGIAASRIHSVAYTANSLFTFGKNEGQLGIIDSDARSMEIQGTPRRVAASLFSSAIIAVSAMDKASVCLLESHEVWIFANYGYAKVSFPLEGFTNHFLRQSFLVTQYDHEPNRIVKVTCGGDTICALSSRGEIHTVSISQRVDGHASSSSSTTNPAKIKSAVPKPQLIWSPKRSNMAARDVGVDADGSIILSTEEGSVWKRTKRATIKDASASGIGEYKPKDYKFSRISGLTRVLGVRASAHGAYAAVRRDCDVTQTQIVVEEPTLWKDIFSLLSLWRSAATNYGTGNEVESEDRLRFWQGQRKPSELILLKRSILKSSDVEADLVDLAQHCRNDPSAKYDTVVTTTTSDIEIPVHRFVLTARSRILRRGFRDLCPTSTFTIPDLAVSETDKDGRTVVKFQGMDILTIVDLVLYLYTDGIVDFWHFTRDAPKMAYRYRQVRAELMKVATKLELGNLEPAARQMVQPRPCLDMDFEVAYQDPAFFYDGDIVVQLEDDEVRVHSALVCARCPFFEGLFMGRAGGRWLAGRDAEDDVHVDLQHVTARVFNIVLRHIYADTDATLFDDLVSVGLDDFLDTVMDIMSVANELMLDRLSQICQQVVGRFVNVRNVCGLLNAISPSSVHEFKDAALEYLCLSLEAMLQGHYLNDLDEDLLEELNDIVRENQLACMPFAKSGRAEQALHERHPELAEELDLARHDRVVALGLRPKLQAMEAFTPGSYNEETPSPVAQKSRKSSKGASRNDQPRLKAKPSSRDMMFALDEEMDRDLHSPEQSPSIPAMSKTDDLDMIASSPQEEVWYDSRGKVLPSPKLAPQSSVSGIATPRTPKSPLTLGKSPPSASQPWNMTPLAGPKNDMRNIMAQTASTRTSSLTQGLAATRSASGDVTTAFSLPAPKMSQKERKRLQQAQQLTMPTADSGSAPQHSSPLPSASVGSPWRTVSQQKAATLRDVLDAAKPITTDKPSSSRASSTPQLTMRQTVAHSKSSRPTIPPKPMIGPSSQVALQHRSNSDTLPKSADPSLPTPQSPPATIQVSTNTRPIPRSIRHTPTPQDLASIASLPSTIAEILNQQQFEKDVVKEAQQKRDLQEIQAEQAFEEWWEKESARVQEAERRGSGVETAAASAGKAGAGEGKRRQRGGRRAGRPKQGESGHGVRSGVGTSHAETGQ